MARIGSALSGIERQLLGSLALANAEITLSNYRMTTGHMINSPKDDPSAFVTLSRLQSQLNTVTATLSNVTAAGSMISQTQTALNSMETQLGVIRTELLKDTDPDDPLTPAERAESQAKIDTAIEQINALAGARINGKTTLAGSADYFYSGRDPGQVADVVGRGWIPSGATISGRVDVTATQAYQTLTNPLGNEIDVSEDTTFTLTGARGSLTVEVHDTESFSDVADFVNSNSYLTGITAEVNEIAHTLTFTSVDYGAKAIVNIEVTDGDATFAGKWAGDAAGANAQAEINGITFDATSTNVSGNRFAVNDNGTIFEIEFQPAFTGTFDTITVEGNALQFTLATDIARPSVIAIPAMFPANLSGLSGRLDQLSSGGSLAMSGLGEITAQAIRVVDEALGKLTRVQGAVDGFYNAAITSSSNILSDMQTKLGDYIDSIDETNDVEETARINYYQALASNAISGLTILNQQRQSIVNMLQDIAGLQQT